LELAAACRADAHIVPCYHIGNERCEAGNGCYFLGNTLGGRAVKARLTQCLDLVELGHRKIACISMAPATPKMATSARNTAINPKMQNKPKNVAPMSCRNVGLSSI